MTSCFVTENIPASGVICTVVIFNILGLQLAQCKGMMNGSLRRERTPLVGKTNHLALANVSVVRDLGC